VTALDITAELDVPHRPDLAPIGRQLDALAPVAARFLVPDNATARAAVAGLVVAAEVRQRDVETVAVLNARDRTPSACAATCSVCWPSGCTRCCCCAVTAPRTTTRTAR
jgi:hypothetical protein